ncbi:MAG: N-glycosylase/DNA lyase [Candidatus Omnitrophota bacterium]
MQQKQINQLKKIYKAKRQEILKRLDDFKKVWAKSDEEIFSELCFCILTPQSKAKVCDSIINNLKKNRLLFKGNVKKIRPFLKKARFYKNKSRYLVECRNFFKNNGRLCMKNRLVNKDILSTREWLVGNIKGIGYKEASHFLRNIGLGDNLAILDIHILRNLKKFGVIKELPKTLTKRLYLETEHKLKKFCQKVKIPPSHLDLLFWSTETGEIFK